MTDEELSSHNDVIEIVMDAGPDADDEYSAPAHINHEYSQRTIKGITYSFMMYDDIYINHSLKLVNPKAFDLNFFKNNDIEQQRLNITYLDPRPDRIASIAWQWFINGLAAIAWAFVIIYTGEYTKYSIAHDVMLPTGILLGTSGIICFMVFYYKTVNKVIYRSLIGQIPVLELFHMPRKKAYNDFIDMFEASIHKAQHRKSVSMKRRLAGELKHLRLMKDSNLIKNSAYEQARDKIFDHEEYQS